MAPVRGRRKHLICFYCNTRSGIRYDGTRQWECTFCDAQNYLDENGEITDPPVATDLAAPANLQFSTRPASPEIWEHDVFCPTCLKNQHIVAMAIAEYPFDTDTRRPGYLQDEREYYKYKQGLENRFPQVCADCEPKVLSQMRQAGKTAKTDHLRRMMEKSREARLAPSRGMSWFGIVLFLNRILWHMSIVGHVLWDFAPIFDWIQARIVSKVQLSSSAAVLLRFITALNSVCLKNNLARYSLICGFISLWWNPEFDPVNKAFKKRLKGFNAWYSHQVILIVFRTVFFYAIRNEISADAPAPEALVAHGASLVVVVYLAVSATSAIKVHKAPLWANTPEKLANIGPSPRSSSPSATRGMESLGDLLDEISRDVRSSGSQQLHSHPSPGSSPSSSPVVKLQTRTPARPQTYTPQRPNSQVQIPYAEDEMEWLPTVPQSSSFRVFTPPSRPQTAQKFGESPVGDQSSPFWYKVPPAPIAPAHRLRNPPNKPAFISQQAKENFFTTKPPTTFTVEPGRSGMEMKQQSLFIPENPNPDGDLLSGMMGSISISEGDAPRRKDVTSRISVAMIGVVAVGVASWCLYQF